MTVRAAPHNSLLDMLICVETLTCHTRHQLTGFVHVSGSANMPRMGYFARVHNGVGCSQGSWTLEPGLQVSLYQAVTVECNNCGGKRVCNGCATLLVFVLSVL